MEIVVAGPEHIDAIDAITAHAKASMAAMGIDQWQSGYPNRDVWTADVAESGAYVALDEGRVVGVFRYCTAPETSYETLDGRWLTGGPYATVHRCAVEGACRGKGVAGALFDHACEKARADGMVSVRIDTHEDNAPMRRAVEKAGFVFCGTIVLADGAEAGAPRIAFEKVLGQKGQGRPGAISLRGGPALMCSERPASC